MKIGILTYCNAYNYGAYLQAYNLSNKINKYEGISAELIDFSMPQELQNYKVRLHKNLLVTYEKIVKKKCFEKARRKLKLSDYCIRTGSNEEFRRLIYGKYDFIIAGSDQIWQVDGFRGAMTPYWLPGDYGCKKIAYAVSGRTPFKNATADAYKKIRDAINDFDYIGVRDHATYENVKSVIEDDRTIHRNLDPSFLMQYVGDKENGRRILLKHGLKLDRPVITVMAEDPNTVIKLKNRLKDTYTFVGLFHRQKQAKNILDVTSFEWADVIAAAQFMVTSYFHGTCFSIINNVPFHTIEMRYKRNESKLFDLLSEFDLTDRFSEKMEKALSSPTFWKQIEEDILDWTPIQNKIKENEKAFNEFVNTLKGISKK